MVPMDDRQALLLDAVARAARKREEMVVRLRRELHRIPEPGFGEVRTTRFVRDFLAERGVELKGRARRTGGVARIGAGEPRVLLRADIDGLPVVEETGLPFTSEHPEYMHACGHDAHVAMLLAAADALLAGEVPLEGSVALFFQPAEEGPGGCRVFLEDGLLKDHPVRAAFALHVWPGLPTGTVGLSAGPVMASMDHLKLTFVGRGGHGAHPEQCADPVVMAAATILSLQTVASRTVSPLEPAVVSVGAIHGGTAPNIIPDRVEAQGTVRAFRESTRRAVEAGVRRVAASAASAHGGVCDVRFDPGYPVTVNDEGSVALLREALASLLGEGAVLPQELSMGAEDMGYLLKEVPGCYMQLGASPDPAAAFPLHNSRFALDEGCLVTGVMAHLAAAALLGGR